MKIKRFEGGELLSNAYVVWEKQGGKCWLIDTGYNGESLAGFVRENGLEAQGVIFTHHHYDHITDGPMVSEILNCDMYIHKRDYDRAKKTLKDNGNRLKSFDDGREFPLEKDKLIAVNTPGHTKGGVCLVSEKSKVAFTGDTVFAMEIGITNLDDGSPEEMAESCKYIKDNFSADMVIYPGHGPEAVMKDVVKNNIEFQEALEFIEK